jgi:hypothetical protein
MSSVQVAVRIRPFNSREIDLNSKSICASNNSNTLTLSLPAEKLANRRQSLNININNPSNFINDHSFTYDYVYTDSANNPNTQETIFNDIGQIIVANSYKGFNCSLMAYGQTGSG